MVKQPSAKANKGVFTVDLSSLNLKSSELKTMDKAIQGAVVAQLASLDKAVNTKLIGPKFGGDVFPWGIKVDFIDKVVKEAAVRTRG